MNVAIIASAAISRWHIPLPIRRCVPRDGTGRQGIPYVGKRAPQHLRACWRPHGTGDGVRDNETRHGNGHGPALQHVPRRGAGRHQSLYSTRWILTLRSKVLPFENKKKNMFSFCFLLTYLYLCTRKHLFINKLSRKK